MNADAALPQRSGLSVLLDVILAPRAAFEALATRTHWGWAFAIICILGCVGAVLQVPAGHHVMVATFTQNPSHDPKIAAMSPADVQQAIKVGSAFQQWTWVFYPLIVLAATAVTALVLLVGSAVGRGQGSFARLFGLAMNVAIVNYGLNYLLIGVLVTLRGPDSFSTQRDLLGTVPSLAWLAPAGSAKVAALLAQINPFQIWSFFLIALGLTVVAKMPRVPAYVAAAIVTFGDAVLTVPFAR
jgi:hypothetical protein